MIFNASYGTATKIATAFVVLIFAVLIGVEAWSEQNVSLFMLMLVGSLIFVLALGYFFSVKHYEITNESLIIHKPFSKSVYKRADIDSVEALDRKLLKFAIRTFGIGGVFGYYGEFYTNKLGSMTWYRTRLDHPVMITMRNKKIVVSPDLPEKFISTLQP